MENLFKKSNTQQLLFLIVLLLMINQNIQAQEWITWATITPNTTGITGTYAEAPDVVNISTSGTGSPLTFQNRPLNTEFWTTGPWPGGTAPVQNLNFQFPEDVLITNFTVRDINRSSGSFDDSFSISNITFSGLTNLDGTSVSCCADTTGVTVGPRMELSWLCSNPVRTFQINFTDPILPTAYLYFSVEIIRVPVFEPLCKYSSSPLLPATIGNGITGSWFPAIINTAVEGVSQYVFTPTAGQAITCPMSINVSVLHEQLTLVSPVNDCNNLSLPTVRHRQSGDWIKATNIVGVGDNVFQNGVVYHAGNFIELNPGFESDFGSQFTAYIEECGAGYNYKNQSKVDSFSDPESDSGKIRIYPNPANSKIQLAYHQSFKSVQIISMEGIIVVNKHSTDDTEEIDVSSLKNGIYLITVETQNGEFLQSKFIKN